MSTDNETSPAPRTVNESEFNADCLAFIDNVTESGAEVVITRDGKPVAKLAPYRDALEFVFGRYQGQFLIYGDIVAPMPAEGCVAFCGVAPTPVPSFAPFPYGFWLLSPQH